MTYRVWARQWVTVYTSDVDGMDGVTECEGHFRHKYEGNVKSDERKITLTGGERWPAILELCLPVVVAEYRQKPNAEAVQEQLASQQTTWLTQYGTPADHELLSYAKRKLPG
jgi:hypothetical protein